MYESPNFGMKFILRGRVCNIPGCEARNREETEVCIAFMHRKSGKFLRFQIKVVKVIESSLELMELK
jgi:FKBP-type peptidyl-prolyl cis-trans isomerase 2